MDEENGETVPGQINELNEAAVPPLDGTLPIASKVEPPKELLDRVKELEEQQQNLPSAVPLNDDEFNGRKRKRRLLFGAGASVLFAIAIILAIVLGVTMRRTKSNRAVPTTLAEPPTPTPTSGDFASLKSLIESVSFDGGAALANRTSPQSKALAWLERNENLQEYPDWRRIQRYVLAVFYYSTNGDEWTDSTGWLSDQDECEWLTFSFEDVCNNDGVFLELAMVDNYLDGTMPVELALLSDSLCKCIHFGPVCCSGRRLIGRRLIPFLLELVTLATHKTMMRGSIPTELGLLTNLGEYLV
jgi:hypothetical protein